jgi:septin family protein
MSGWVCRNPLAQMEEEKRDHEAKMKKMETEMEQVFEMKVREKKQKLKDSEADVSIYMLLTRLERSVYKETFVIGMFYCEI